jgi:hypothetical protein
LNILLFWMPVMVSGVLGLNRKSMIFMAGSPFGCVPRRAAAA